MNNICTTTDKEQRQQVRAIIVDIVRKMLNRQLNIKWTGNKVDLFEMVHIAYLSMEIRRSDGTLMFQSEMLRNLFEWQGFTLPSNERIYGNRINARRGVLVKSIVERLQYLLFVSGVKDDPITLLRELGLVEVKKD